MKNTADFQPSNGKRQNLKNRKFKIENLRRYKLKEINEEKKNKRRLRKEDNYNRWNVKQNVLKEKHVKC